ncbi:Ribosome production factor 2 isoform 2 [Schistosoma japonicum]|uniref:Ribosome production factor 2 homolog n=2 Tax=Schistosoma japonicum TaxID=6182 RepID=A0A4Z2CUY6_SCHJA|nr:Ribosome production factor 2 isoform 2 [Schistosoma japonicum]TNN08070.1 Ribosome production factor 2 isoform 2 [Schistosoma japonicum]
MAVISDIRKPKTHKGKRVLERRAPKLVENDKCTLVIKGGHTSGTVTAFLNDLCALKKPLVYRLKWKNTVLPFEDLSFIEKMCSKFDCSMFVVGMHSKKRPHNIIIGRLHDGELLDMFELGIKMYKPLSDCKDKTLIYGSKPMLLFSGELFNVDMKYMTLKSLLADLFKGPTIEKIRTLGVEHQFHFVLSSDKNLCLRIRKINLSTINRISSSEFTFPPLKTPDGRAVQISLEDATPSVDFELRRVCLPSEDKWKRAHRVPPEVIKGDKTPKNKHTDVFGSRIGRVHVGKSSELENLRPGSSIRTALTGHRKRGFERIKSGASNSGKTLVSKDVNANKRRKLFTDA